MVDTRQMAATHYKSLKYRMAIGFSIVFILVVTTVAVTILYQTNKILTNKILYLTQGIANQITCSLNSVSESQEKKMEVLFLHSTEAETGTSDQNMVFLSRVRALQNFGALAVCYADGSVMGNLTDESVNAIGKPLYTVLNSYLEEKESERAWIAADDISCGFVFFIRKAEDASIIITAFPIASIAEYISPAETANGITIRVVSPNGIVLYSSEERETGLSLDMRDVDILNSRIGLPQIVGNDISIVNQCQNGWLVTISGTLSDLLKERYAAIQFAIVILFLAISVIVLFSIIYSMKLTLPVTTLVRRLYDQSIRDPDTRLYVKEYFGDCVRRSMEDQEYDKYALIQLDIDDYQQMHNMRGNTFCDRIIHELADAMIATFPEDAILGRIGHDRFMVFSRLPGDSFQTIHQWCLAVQDSFRDRVEKSENASGVSVSAGVVLIPEHGTDFDMLCELSDRALFNIKNRGKNGYHIYTPEDDIDVWRYPR